MTEENMNNSVVSENEQEESSAVEASISGERDGLVSASEAKEAVDEGLPKKICKNCSNQLLLPRLNLTEYKTC
ncbi:MAG: hypothetical protein LBQ96_05050 [Fusobacteriaceae bacterium]|jgi:hypothetical protein|nr:hypothetical protein [Fusobacteriaceae bacterium]